FPTTSRASQSIDFKFDIGASHGGEDCQLTLSYDGGKEPRSGLTSKRSSNSAVGNRELCSNCVDMQMKGTKGGAPTGKGPVIINYDPKSQRVGEFSGANNKGGRKLLSLPSRKSYTFHALPSLKWLSSHSI
ncbi:hypothetical protein DFQ27_009477, partial [Actinomortierella ambigua]